MSSKFLLLATLPLLFFACENPSHTHTHTVQPDNTARNTIIPSDQSEEGADLAITQDIHKAIMTDNNLSTNAKNVKVVTNKRVVTLRGVVDSAAEKEAVAKHAEVSGVTRIDNQLEVKPTL